MTDMDSLANASKGVWAPLAQRLRQVRVQAFTQYCIANEGQEITVVLKGYSKSTGVAMRTVTEYWDVVSMDNRGPIYEKHGVVTVRKAFRRWVK